MRCVSAEGMCADIRSKCTDSRLGSGQKTFRKETERDRLRTWDSEREGLSPIERLGGARMCADSGRTHVETIQEVRRSRQRK